MNYIVIFILIGLLVVITRHLVWRGMASIIRKTMFGISSNQRCENSSKNNTQYADAKYKNQQFVISAVGFLMVSIVLILIFIYFPDIWIGYQIMLIVAAVLVPGVVIGILFSRRKG